VGMTRCDFAETVERKAFYRDRVGTGSVAERVANLVELRKAEGYMQSGMPPTIQRLTPATISY